MDAPLPPAGAAAGMMPRRPTVLLRELIQTSADFEAAFGEELSVNATDLDAMEHLLQEGPLGPSELARRLGITTAAMTTAVDRLVDLGHVTREPHPSDRRAVRVVPTDSSRAKAMSILMPMVRGLDAELDHFDEDEQRIITEYLERILTAYRAHTPEPSRARRVR
ncbi:MarR family winged helix-turn-helix transcriptional regulator [Microbacterium aurantiacum]|nr:MarR family transcriptional regulator [Microbacterium aurantiacum]